MSITANIPGLPDDDDASSEQFGTVNPSTLAQPKIDDRGAHVPAQRTPFLMAQATECPRPWCPNIHTPDDGIVGESDRECVVDAPGLPVGNLRLRHHRSVESNALGTGFLTLTMVQGEHEIAPRILVGRSTGKQDKDPEWLVLTRDEAELLAQQLGLLCDLGETPLPVTLTGHRAPFWQVADCPAWCEIHHQAGDQYPNRTHMGEGSLPRMGLLLMDSDGEQPSRLELTLIQHYRSTVPAVDVSRGSGRPGWVRLSLGEARRLSSSLLDLVTLADSDAGRVTR